MNNRRLAPIGVILALTILVVVRVNLPAATTCNVHYRQDTVIKTARSLVVAEVARTGTQQTTGLSGRACIGSNQGMLFEFNESGFYPFWMKDMKFSIDMVWISSAHNVVTIKPDVSPYTYPQTFVNTAPAQYVLEVQANEAQKLAITNGATLQFNP